MTPKEFEKKWKNDEDSLSPFNKKIIDTLSVSKKVKEYLSYGLPEEAAPYLRFGPASGSNLQTAAEQFNLSKEFNSFRIIGVNAYGDPICLDENDEDIVYLNHDDGFGYVLVNSSIEQLAIYLLEVRDFIQLLNDSSNKSEKKFLNQTLDKLQAIDPEAMKFSGWEDEIRSLIK